MKMDTPPPIATKSKEYTLNSEGKKFKIRINLSSKITIEANELDKIKGVFYSNIFSLEALVQHSQGFRICEDINEALDTIVQIFENKKADIKYNHENEVLLIIKVDLPGGKVQEVNLTLYKKEMNKDLLIDELIVKVNKLEEENKNIKERLNLFEKYFAEEIQNKKLIEEIGIDTKIIDKKEDLQFIYNRLVDNDENLRQKKIKYNLLYRATRDGDSSTSFHNRVDNKKSLLSIIKAGGGMKFGFYIEKPYKKTGNWEKDNKSFIYSLNLKKIYNIKEDAYSFRDDPSDMVDLYNSPIRTYDNFLARKDCHTCTKSNADASFYGFEKDYELNNGKQNFTVQEMETFQISFN